VRLSQKPLRKVDPFFQLRYPMVQDINFIQSSLHSIHFGPKRGIDAALALNPSGKGSHEGPEDDHARRQRGNYDKDDGWRTTMLHHRALSPFPSALRS
jgi:hypothetical protein